MPDEKIIMSKAEYYDLIQAVLFTSTHFNITDKEAFSRVQNAALSARDLLIKIGDSNLLVNPIVGEDRRVGEYDRRWNRKEDKRLRHVQFNKDDEQHKLDVEQHREYEKQVREEE